MSASATNDGRTGLARCRALASVLLAATAGCVPSYPLDDETLDRHWSLSDSVLPRAAPYRPTFGERKLPSRWTIRQRKSVIWSTVSLVRAVDPFEKGADHIEFSISPTHVKTLEQILAETREALAEFGQIIDPETPSDRRRWAETVAHTLVQLEYITRLATGEETGGRGPDAPEPMGLAAEPLLEMIALYLNERTGGTLLKGLRAEDLDQLRQVLAQMVLRLGLAAAGKQQPDGLRERVAEAMHAAEDLDALETSFRQLLAETVDRAPPAPPEGQLREGVRAVTTWGPRALRVLEGLIGQWDRMESVDLQLRRHDGQTVLAATVRTLPRREVRIADTIILQPAIVFRGATRVVVQPDTPGTKETVVTFEPIDGGAAEVRFEGVLYGLVRLLALPLADGALREVRVFTGARQQGTRLVHVAVLMEARGDKADPRRLMMLQDVRTERLRRGASSLRTVVERTEQIFNYLTPGRRYTYRRVKTPAGP